MAETVSPEALAVRAEFETWDGAPGPKRHFAAAFVDVDALCAHVVELRKRPVATPEMVEFMDAARAFVHAQRRSGGWERYSPDLFRETIAQRLTDWIEGEDLTADQIEELKEQVADEVLSCADDGEQAAHCAARDFRFNGDEVFTDFWETNLRDYTFGFVWACHAIVWAIAQYDAAKAAAVEVPAHA